MSSATTRTATTRTATSRAATIGVLGETAADERRVALDPSAVAALVKSGHAVLIETGAGKGSNFFDAAYTAAGARIASRKQVIDDSDALVVVRAPAESLTSKLRAEQTIIGLLDPFNSLEQLRDLAERRVTAVAFELLPRTVSRAQSMDALSSQASAAGYRAAIVAAEAYGRYLPMMITASGTATPAKVIVMGTGVAGLQAIATTRRLGAVVTGYDVRAASRQEVESLGATFLTSTIAQGEGSGGYARALTPEERAAQQEELATALKSFDVIITTAKVPGRTPPELVSQQTIESLRPGSVCVDLGSSDRGGNVAGSVPGSRILTPGGVTIIGAGELASDLPASSSQMYGRNVVAVIASLMPDGVLAFDSDDEIHRNIVVCTGGRIVNEAVRTALDPKPAAATHEKVHAS
ncbi:MAG: H+-translocating transhydrogenase subunit alpha [Actinomycetota bacterium]|nr:H+-translocating transhydrogenase subunit alpha [Actinomycetota bacterium]